MIFNTESIKKKFLGILELLELSLFHSFISVQRNKD